MSRRKKVDRVRRDIYEPFIGAHHPDRTEARKEYIARMYYRILSEMCLNRFRWSGLPDTIDQRFLEWCLYTNALSVFYFDKDYDRFLALKGSGAGVQNMYDNPTRFIVTGNTMINKTLSAQDCVPIWANAMRTPDLDIVQIFSERLAEIETSFDIDVMHMRHPFLISVDADEKLSLVNAYRKVCEGEPVIVGTQSLNAQVLQDKMNVFNTGLPYQTVESLLKVRGDTWRTCLNLLGILTVNDEKKERMVVDEANAASGQVLAARGVALNARRDAAERINERYDLDVTVDWCLDNDSDNPFFPDMPSPLGGDING